MAEMDLFGRIRPDTSGQVIPKPSNLIDTNDLVPHDVWVFQDNGTKVGVTVAFRLPDNYTGTPVFKWLWRAAGTTGNVVWDVDYKCVGAGESADPSAYDQSGTVTDAHAGTAHALNAASFTPTAGNFAAGDLVLLTFSRDCADAADTMNGVDAILEALWLDYAT